MKKINKVEDIGWIKEDYEINYWLSFFLDNLNNKHQFITTLKNEIKKPVEHTETITLSSSGTYLKIYKMPSFGIFFSSYSNFDFYKKNLKEININEKFTIEKDISFKQFYGTSSILHKNILLYTRPVLLEPLLKLLTNKDFVIDINDNTGTETIYSIYGTNDIFILQTGLLTKHSSSMSIISNYKNNTSKYNYLISSLGCFKIPKEFYNNNIDIYSNLSEMIGSNNMEITEDYLYTCLSEKFFLNDFK